MMLTMARQESGCVLLPVLLLLMLHVLLLTPGVSASQPAPGCPACCYVAPRSACCQGCLGDAAPRPATPTMAPPPPPASLRLGSVGHADKVGEGVLGALERASALSLPGCQCCLRQLTRQPRSSLVLSTCCALCHRRMEEREEEEEEEEEEEAAAEGDEERRPLEGKRGRGGSASSSILGTSGRRGPANALPSCLLQSIRPARVPADVSRSDVITALMTSQLVKKRTTSMDCMCCMNSGISDCCSKCRIF